MNLNVVFDSFPILETPRLTLRELRPDDRNAIYQLFGNNAVTRFLEIEPFPNIEWADQLINQMHQRYINRYSIRWGIIFNSGVDRLIGTCGFNVFDHRGDFGEIGYDIHPAYWGQGIATEAVSAMSRFGFNEINLNRIEACVVVGNYGSAQVLTKLGFRFEGIMRQRGFWKNKYHDLEWYSLLRDDLRP